MNEFSKYLLAGQPPGLVDELEPTLPTVAEALGGNPRALIRFVNNILIDYAISSDLPEFAKIGGIPLRYFIISRSLEHQWPEVFDALTHDDDLVEEVATWSPDTYHNHAAGTGAAASVAAKLLIDLGLRRILTGPQGQDWLNNSAFRKASVSFLLTQQRFSPLDASEVNIRYDAFVSFPPGNRGEVLKIVEEVSRAGIKIYLDEKIQPGDDWRSTHMKILASVDTILFFIGKGTAHSAWQEQELRITEWRSDLQPTVRIIPVVLPGADIDDVPMPLRSLHWVSFREGISPDGIERLISALRVGSRR